MRGCAGAGSYTPTENTNFASWGYKFLAVNLSRNPRSFKEWPVYIAWSLPEQKTLKGALSFIGICPWIICQQLAVQCRVEQNLFPNGSRRGLRLDGYAFYSKCVHLCVCVCARGSLWRLLVEDAETQKLVA